MHPSESQPILRLVQAVTQSSFACANAIKPGIGFLTRDENNARWALVLNEFYFFFLHMLNRHALMALGDGGRGELQDRVGPLVVGSLVESVYGHWPDDRKQGLRGEFYDNMNRAELEYANCNCLIPEGGDPFSTKALLVKLAQNVTNLCANPTDKKLIWTVIETTWNELKRVNLEKLVADTRDELDLGSLN
jgi:hypothetical protein